MKTTFRGEDRFTSEELVDKTVSITSVRTDKDGTMLAYSTTQFKIYVYDLKKNFAFDKIGKVYYNINFIFFNPTNSIVFCCGQKGLLRGFQLFND